MHEFYNYLERSAERKEIKKEIIQKYSDCNISDAEFAELHGIKYNDLKKWKYKYKLKSKFDDSNKSDINNFAQVKIINKQDNNSQITLQIGKKYKILIDENFNQSTLLKLLNIVEARSC